MRKLIMFFTIVFVPAMSTSGQNLIPVSAYIHLTGTINQNIPATLELVKNNDSLYADFQVSSGPGDMPGHNDSLAKGRPLCIALAGKMGPNGTFQLTEPFTGNGVVLNGKIEASLKVTGKFKNGEKDEMPFELSEKYPDGTVQFNLFSDREVKKLAKKPQSPEARIGLAVIIPAESGNAVISDTLRRVIQLCFFGKSDIDSMPEDLIKGMKSTFFENYISSNESLYDEMPDGRSFDWEMLKYMHILNNRDYLLTFYIISYGFTGGAHGLETCDYYSADIRTGRLLKLDDIFLPDSRAALTLLLTNKLRLEAGLDDTQKLSDAGYFVEEIKPNENFYITTEGIGFLYNHYDIAPYSFGATKLFLTTEDLKGLIK